MSNKYKYNIFTGKLDLVGREYPELEDFFKNTNCYIHYI